MSRLFFVLERSWLAVKRKTPRMRRQKVEKNKGMERE
jgi:hypothetical protein